MISKEQIIKDFTSLILEIQQDNTNMDLEEFNELMARTINEAISLYNNSTKKTDYEEFFQENLKSIFDSLKELTSAKQLLTDYLDVLDISSIKTVKKAKQELNKICELIEGLTQDEIFDLIVCNKKFNDLCEFIVTKAQESKTNNNLDYIYTGLYNHMAVELIGFYIMENDLSFNDGNVIADSSIKMYIEEIKRNPSKYAPLDFEEEKELFKQLEAGDMSARTKLIEHNLRLVISVAKNYVNKGLDFEDLIQEGNIGLMTAISRFDNTKETKLSTYAMWWIRQGILRSIDDKGRAIRIPVHENLEINKFKKTFSILTNKLFREPTDEEMQEVLGWPQEKYKRIKLSLGGIVSLEDPVGDEEDDLKLVSLIPSDENVEEDVANEIIKGSINKLLENAVKLQLIKPNAAKILRLRYQLNGEEESATLESVGQQMGLTRERVRQIQKKALRTLLLFMLNYPTEAFSDIDIAEEDVRVKYPGRLRVPSEEKLERSLSLLNDSFGIDNEAMKRLLSLKKGDY